MYNLRVTSQRVLELLIILYRIHEPFCSLQLFRWSVSSANYQAHRTCARAANVFFVRRAVMSSVFFGVNYSIFVSRCDLYWLDLISCDHWEKLNSTVFGESLNLFDTLMFPISQFLFLRSLFQFAMLRYNSHYNNSISSGNLANLSLSANDRFFLVCVVFGCCVFISPFL